MDVPPTERVDERLESVPWADLVRPSPDPRRRVILALIGVAVAAVVASAARTLWPPPPLTSPIVVGDASTNSVEFEVPPSAPSKIDGVAGDPLPVSPELVAVSPISEADLRAVSPTDASRLAVAYAELFVSQWLTLDGGEANAADEMLPIGVVVEGVDPSARSFVESAIGMSATEVHASTWQVEVVVRSLSAFADGNYVRVPPRAYSVTIRLTDDGPAIVDLPSPAVVAISQVEPVATKSGEAPEAVMAKARSIMSVVGLIDEATLGASQKDDVWRIAGVVRDIAGVPVWIAVWLDGFGNQIAVPVG